MTKRSAPVAGADGCRAGWLVVRVGPDGPPGAEAAILPGAASLLSLGASVVGVDMPIGLLDLPDRTGRPVDRQARAFLLSRADATVAGTGSRVFPAPSRRHLALLPLGYHGANAQLPQGARFTQQAFNIASRIAELDATLPPDGPVHEVHPEVSFATLTGRTLPRKKSPEGRAARLQALAALGFDPERLAATLGPRTGRWAPDDLLDACAVAWSAERIREGRHITLPHPPERDSRGHRMAIHA